MRWNPDNFSEDPRDINRKQSLPRPCLDFRHTFGSVGARLVLKRVNIVPYFAGKS